MATRDNSRMAIRARIILGLSQGLAVQAICAALRISRPSVSKWRVRWKQGGIEGLRDVPGRGRKTKAAAWEDVAEFMPPLNAIEKPKNEEQTTPRVTFEAIARYANVSISTVSRALSNRSGVGAATAKRIRAVAKSLNYQADPALSALIAYRGHVRKAADYGTLALLNARGKDEKHLPEFLQLQMQGMRQTCGELGYHLELFEITPDQNSHRQVSRELYSRGIRGVVVASVPENWPHIHLQWKHFSAVAVGRSLRSPLLHCVTPNHHTAVETLYKKLRDFGYRKIGFCNRMGSEQNMQYMNLAVYLRCLVLDGGSSDASTPYLFESGKTLNPLPWLERHGFDAVICGWSDSIRKLLKGTHFKVPQTLGLADISAHVAKPEFSGMVQNERGVGSAAISLLHANLLRNLRGIPPMSERQTVTIEASWRRGATIRRQ